MTDKQIMLDGVDVLKEKINMCFILLLNKLETPETIEQTIYEHLDVFIEEWNKQLKRKEQECEELKLQLTSLGYADAICALEIDLEHKTQECEKLKQKLHQCWTVENSFVEQLDQLEAENEELKKQLQAQRDFTRHEQKLIYCLAYDETCKTGNDCKQEKCIFKDNIKLKQALAEIKDIAEKRNYLDYNECLDDILQKISEVKNE